MAARRPAVNKTPTKTPNTAVSKTAKAVAKVAPSPRPCVDMQAARKALVLQGGGALGSYQAGVYEALSRRGIHPEWVAGVSIGAINAALIAGNAPNRRVERLREFWSLVSSAPAQRIPLAFGDRSTQNQWSANAAVMFGIPGFFRPSGSPLLLMGNASPELSYYDTTPLRQTLERLVDFDRINAGEMRFSVGAANVVSGDSKYFDNTDPDTKIGPEHVMASGALPPGFPPVQVEKQFYWDGGIVSNTPLQYVLDAQSHKEALVVWQVDLFSARGAMPTTMSEVMERQKDITYSSRTRRNTDALASNLNLQQAIADLIGKLPPALRNDPSVAAVQAQLTHQPIDIFHLIYRDKPYETESKDYEFSRATVEDHWAAGLRDMEQTLAHPESLRSEAQTNGVTTFDLTEPGNERVERPI
jgi:NTE family protein